MPTTSLEALLRTKLRSELVNIISQAIKKKETQKDQKVEISQIFLGIIIQKNFMIYSVITLKKAELHQNV